MNFNGKLTEGLGEQKSMLAANKIHTVTFDGVEKVDLKNGELHCLRIKFSNDEGYFNHTIFEPQPGDDQETDNAFGGKNPSRVMEMMTLLRHLGAGISCPELNQKISEFDNKTTWEQIRNIVVETTAPAIGNETKIKLLGRKRTDVNTGVEYTDPVFPAFFLAYTQDGRLYMRTNFIGKGVYFSTKELGAIKKQTEAKPVAASEFTNTAAPKKDNSFTEEAKATLGKSDFDMNI